MTNGKTGSRNLSRVQLSNSIGILESRLHIGGEDTTSAIAGLPVTKHDISGPPEKFSIDCFPVPHGQDMALMLTVHGEFVEYPMQGLRSFDRIFFLLPAPPGSMYVSSLSEIMHLLILVVPKRLVGMSSFFQTPGPFALIPAAMRGNLDHCLSKPPPNCNRKSTASRRRMFSSKPKLKLHSPLYPKTRKLL